MYRHCIYCKTDLGDNEVIEHFPIGRRLAFDAAQGRLWVVCRQCHRWNLTPLEERWEAIESCERLYRDTRTRLATENIGLARLGDGTDVVRIGEPQRPEFAAWRYGDQLVQRRRRSMKRGLITVAIGGAVFAVGGVALGASSLVGSQLMFMLPTQLLALYHAKRGIVSIPDHRGSPRKYSRRDIEQSQLLPTTNGWRLRIPHRDGGIELAGPRAQRAAALILPRINHTGAHDNVVHAALKDIQLTSTTDKYFERVAQHLEATDLYFMGGRYHGFLIRAPRPMLVALEMLTHEDQERRALEGELHELEAMWREAEEIAAISDNLLLPRSVTNLFRRHKESQ